MLFGTDMGHADTESAHVPNAGKQIVGDALMTQSTAELRTRASKDKRMKGNEKANCPHCRWSGKRKKLDDHISTVHGRT